jgi:hypothetical protein
MSAGEHPFAHANSPHVTLQMPASSMVSGSPFDSLQPNADSIPMPAAQMSAPQQVQPMQPQNQENSALYGAVYSGVSVYEMMCQNVVCLLFLALLGIFLASLGKGLQTILVEKM